VKTLTVEEATPGLGRLVELALAGNKSKSAREMVLLNYGRRRKRDLSMTND
jgi:hypothetical protein